MSRKANTNRIIKSLKCVNSQCTGSSTRIHQLTQKHAQAHNWQDRICCDGHAPLDRQLSLSPQIQQLRTESFASKCVKNWISANSYRFVQLHIRFVLIDVQFFKRIDGDAVEMKFLANLQDGTAKESWQKECQHPLFEKCSLPDRHGIWFPNHGNDIGNFAQYFHDHDIERLHAWYVKTLVEKGIIRMPRRCKEKQNAVDTSVNNATVSIWREFPAQIDGVLLLDVSQNRIPASP